MIYMDYNSTTPLNNEVKDELSKQFDNFGNASGIHTISQRADGLLTDSRIRIARYLGCEDEELIFTSGGTESNNTVLNQLFLSSRYKNLIISTIEHSSVVETAVRLENNGIEVKRVSVGKRGLLNLDELKKAVEKDSLVSIIFANNEIGTVQDISTIAEIVKGVGAFLHVDGTQAFGKIRFSLKDIPIDFLTISAHKIYGPKGIGGLFIRRRTPFTPFIIGGGQEFEKRSGTQNPPLAAAFAKAVEVRNRIQDNESIRLREYKAHLISKLQKISGVTINGTIELNSLANTISFTVSDIENEILLLYLDMASIAVSSGSACSARSFKPSSVLQAIGLSESEAFRSIRISMGAGNSLEEVEKVIEEITTIIERVRARRA